MISLFSNIYNSVASYLNNNIDESLSNSMTHFSEQSDQNPLELQSVIDEMNRRSTNIAYGSGIALQKIFKSKSQKRVSESDEKAINPIDINLKDLTLESELFDYTRIFSEKTQNIFYIELDPGVDDTAALVQLLAYKNNQDSSDLTRKKIEILGVTPCVGNAVLSQTEKNTLQILELTKDTDIPVYPGAVAPLSIENNTTAITKMNEGINKTHFYGYDGESDVGGWSIVTMNPQKISGYQFAANLIFNASSGPITLISTSALTELAKTFYELEMIDPTGSFSKNIQAISIMGGCINPKSGCNAPFNVPDSNKTSEANFYFDPIAAQRVFTICQKYQIPILLSTLDLTQQPNLFWTNKQVEILKKINNPVSNQIAKITSIVPYLDAPCFPNNSYPMHDLQAVTALLYPQLYNVTRMAVNISEIGEIIINSNASESQKNVYVLSMSIENQKKFYERILKEYNNFDSSYSFNEDKLIQKIIIIASILFGIGITISLCSKAKKCKIESEEQQKLLI